MADLVGVEEEAVDIDEEEDVSFKKDMVVVEEEGVVDIGEEEVSLE